MRRTLTVLFWVALYAAFVGAAVLLRAGFPQPEDAELFGWDYGLYLRQLQDWRWIAYTGFRHPGLGFVMSPLVALEHLWAEAYLLVMPLVALATAFCICRIGGIWALAAYLTLPSTWLLAGTPESFPVAQLCLVAGVACGATKSLRATLGFAALNGAVTLTNGLKPVLAFFLARPRRTDARRLVAVLAALVLALAAFFFVRSLVTGRPYDEGILKTLAWIPASRQLGRELYDFFIRPAGIAALLVYPLAFVGCVRIVRCGSAEERALLRTLAAYFAVDALLHLVIGWGMEEGFVFAPHHLWIVAILAGLALRRDQAERH